MDHHTMMKQIVEERAKRAQEFHNEVLRSPDLWGANDIIGGTPLTGDIYMDNAKRIIHLPRRANGADIG